MYTQFAKTKTAMVNKIRKDTKNTINVWIWLQHSIFAIKTSDYLPEDYSLSRAYTYKDSDGSLSGEYLTLVYKNGKGNEISVFERLLNEETAFEAGTDGSLEEVTINGRTAAMMHETSLSFETEDNVSVTINTYGNVSKEELLKIAKGMK